MRLFTVVATIPVVALLTQPLWAPAWGAGILGEVVGLGPLGAIAGIIVFFGLVALYCNQLYSLARTLPTFAREADPRSVWLMFAIPFNFVEDFFIVRAIGAALDRAGIARAKPWLIIGFAWCGFQIASLFPGIVGVVSGVLALVVWAVHWVLTVSVLREVTSREIQ